MEGSRFRRANFSGVYLFRGVLIGIDLRWPRFHKADMTAASAEEVNFSGADLPLAQLKGARLIATIFVGRGSAASILTMPVSS